MLTRSWRTLLLRSFAELLCQIILQAELLDEPELFLEEIDAAFFLGEKGGSDFRGLMPDRSGWNHPCQQSLWTLTVAIWNGFTENVKSCAEADKGCSFCSTALHMLAA